MEGSADLAHETQDLRVVVVPELNAASAALAYAAINPAMGLGTFFAQWLLREPLRRPARANSASPAAGPTRRSSSCERRGDAPGRGARRRPRRPHPRARHRAAPSTATERPPAMKIAALQMVSTPDVARNLAAAAG